MKLLTLDELSEFSRTLGYAAAADSDGVRRALESFRYADRHRTDGTATVRALAGAQAVAKRLLDMEAEYAVVRSTVARLVVANNRGDDYDLGDLASELHRQDVDLTHDYDIADDLARAAEREGLL
ncbi:hypothetical protein [Streptomyces sp. NPDC057257]|uniref:hypothetical protein n=1 Tax=Streptomyces sp. NPDC057257 TaxID=3346071 RepID=UPI00363301DB